MRKILLSIACVLACMSADCQTLDECQQAARDNYPLIGRYGLIEKTTQLTVENIAKKGWLPQVEAYGQGTLQSGVAQLPDVLTQMTSQMGYSARGLSKAQYKAGLNASQTIYDGGAISARKQVVRAQANVERAQTDVDMYQVRQRVNELFFGILLVEERIQIAQDLSALLKSNEQQLEKMFRGGVAMECDYNSIKAERISADRQLTELNATRNQLQQVLSVFTGMQIGKLVRPDETLAGAGNNRPELRLLDNQLLLADAQEKEVKAGLMPTVGAFAQGYYGYPGYDMFHDMFHRKPTLNGIVGLKVSWNISNLFTHKNDLAKVGLQREYAENQREIFLFNNRMEQIQQTDEINKYRKMIDEDREIVDLRTKVRKSHESKLRHGIINVNDLLQEITRESNAKTELSIHEVEMLKAMYDLKFLVCSF